MEKLGRNERNLRVRFILTYNYQTEIGRAAQAEVIYGAPREGSLRRAERIASLEISAYKDFDFRDFRRHYEGIDALDVWIQSKLEGEQNNLPFIARNGSYSFPETGHKGKKDDAIGEKERMLAKLGLTSPPLSPIEKDVDLFPDKKIIPPEEFNKFSDIKYPKYTLNKLISNYKNTSEKIIPKGKSVEELLADIRFRQRLEDAGLVPKKRSDIKS